MTIIHSLELHHRAKHRQAKKSLWLSCLRIWFWWRLSGYHITHNRGENKIPLLETLTTGSFHPWLYWQGLQQISVTHQAREKMMPIPTLWSRYPEGEEGHTAGDTHGQERRAGRWFGLKFSYPGVTTHGSTPAVSGTPLLTGRHQQCLSPAKWAHTWQWLVGPADWSRVHPCSTHISAICSPGKHWIFTYRVENYQDLLLFLPQNLWMAPITVST